MDLYIKIIHNKFEEIFAKHPDLRFDYQPVSSVNQPVNQPVNQLNKCELESNMLNFLCPHCEYFTQVALNDLNCRIFRHGFFVQRNNKNEIVALLNQIDPHETEEACNNYRNNPNITGCCKPFQIINKGSDYFVQKCGYI